MSAAAQLSPASKHSPVMTIRAGALMGILAAVVAAYAYDYLVAAPHSERAYENVQLLVDRQNASSVQSGQPPTSADVQKVIGFAPTFRQVEAHYTIEWYCWWGWIPGLNTWKRYVTVVYAGNEPRHVNSHYINEAPPQESLPKYYLPTGIAEPLPVPGPLGMPGPVPAPGARDPGKKGESQPAASESEEKPGTSDKQNGAALLPTSDGPGKAD